MAAIFSATILLGPTFTTVLFAALSFLAMREFVTLTRTDRADHEEHGDDRVERDLEGGRDVAEVLISEGVCRRWRWDRF